MDRIHSLNNHLVPPQGSSLEPNETAAASSKVPLLEYYDYIVVGAGSAGAVVAGRLSEDPKVTVLLLEAGVEDNSFIVNTPIMYGKQQLTDLDWQFKTEKQAQQNDRVSLWPRGKVLGGSSSINAMIYVRGDKENFDSWERDGCTGWGYKDVLPYFMKSEKSHLPEEDAGYHGKNGEIGINRPVTDQYVDGWVKAGVQAGIPYNKDYNGASMHGISYAQSNVHQGIRQNTSRAFLTPHRGTRKNLTVATMAHVTKLIFQGTTVTGVQLKRGSVKLEELRKKKTEVVFCNKEVILCGGAINTPWLLLNSGVGPRKQLEELGIPVVADLPVGQNLQDHVIVFQGFQTKEPGPLKPKIDLVAIKILLQYLITGGGLAAHSHLRGTSFLTTGLRGDNSPAPDLQIHFYPGTLGPEIAEAANLQDPFWTKVEQTWTHNAITMVPTLVRPKSVGDIRLRSKDLFEYPIIQPNYFTDPEGYDLKIMVEGMKLTRKIAKQPALANIIKQEALDVTIPHPPDSDEYLIAFLKKSALTVYHPVGTCKMGAPTDHTAVVDPALKVLGVKGLRVADASIMPNIVSGNTNAACIMIGEKAADLIKADQRK